MREWTDIVWVRGLLFVAVCALGVIAEPSVAQTAEAAAGSAGDAPPTGVVGRLVSPGTRPILNREERHRWERHVRGFRREHNFSTSAGVSSGKWVVRRLGSLEDRSFDGSGLYSKFQYSFHLQFFEGFGYMLGSSAGYHYESADRRRPFRPVPAVMLPSVLAGLVYNITPAFRFSIAGEAYLERMEGLAERDNVGEDSEIYINMLTYDLGGYLDIFYDLAWAIRLEAHARRSEFIPPKESDKIPVIDARLRREDQWLGVGLVFHLL